MGRQNFRVLKKTRERQWYRKRGWAVSLLLSMHSFRKPTSNSNWDVLLWKLIDGRCWFRTHVALVGLAVRVFRGFFRTLLSLRQCGLGYLGRWRIKGKNLTEGNPPPLYWPISHVQVIGYLRALFQWQKTLMFSYISEFGDPSISGSQIDLPMQ